MPRMTDRELQEELEIYHDDEDDALLRHVLLDDQEIPQGLHRGGMTAEQVREIESHQAYLEAEEACWFKELKYPVSMWDEEHDLGGYTCE